MFTTFSHVDNFEWTEFLSELLLRADHRRVIKCKEEVQSDFKRVNPLLISVDARRSAVADDSHFAVLTRWNIWLDFYRNLS